MEIAPTTLLLMTVLLFALGFGSGVFGLGIGLVAAPVISFFLREQLPNTAALSLALNAVTCAAALAVFAPKGLVAWKHALGLGAVSALFTPLAAVAALPVPPYITWYVYLGAVLFFVLHLLRPPRGHALPHVNWTVLYVGAAPTALVAGFTGIGPGFALMPGLVVAGMDVRHAAATAAAASIIPSLTALLPLHPVGVFASLPMSLLIPVAGAIVGTVLGSSLELRHEISLRWQRAFAWFVAALALAHFFTLGWSNFS